MQPSGAGWRDPGARPAVGPPPSGLGAAAAGAGDLFRGMRLFLRTPGVRLLGVLPVVLAGLLALALLGVLLAFLDDLARALTPFAAGWPAEARTLARALAGLAVLLAGLALLVVSFATLCQVLGQPFYETISDRVERRLGGAPPATGTPWWRTFPRATLESAVLFALTLGAAALLFVVDVVPVLGQTAGPVLSALVSGFLLAVELLAIPLERRGLHLVGRLRFAWHHRAAVAGFGATAFVLFLVPLLSLVAMPGAVVGAVLLVRRLTGQPVAPRRPG